MMDSPDPKRWRTLGVLCLSLRIVSIDGTHNVPPDIAVEVRSSITNSL